MCDPQTHKQKSDTRAIPGRYQAIPGTPTFVQFLQRGFGLFLPGGVAGFGGGTIPLPGGKHP